jgi:SSS family solute:Na+ symporter
MIGLFMRGQCITADEVAALTAAGQAVPQGMLQIASSSQVFPQFVVHYLPALFGGVVLGTLFITVVGGGAGLSLGVATVLAQDLLAGITSAWDANKKLLLTRALIVVVLVCAGAAALLLPGSMINDFGFLSMGLRGAVIFVPMTFALFAKGRVAGTWALCSVIAGPVAVIVGNLAGLPFDPLFLGVAVNLVVMFCGLAAGPKVVR